MKFKRILSALLSVALITATFSFVCTANAVTTDDYVKYTVKGKTLIITECNAPLPKYSYAFQQKSYGKDFTKVVVEEGVTALPHLAFENFFELTSVTLPSTLKVIGLNAFHNCSALKEITIPKSTEKIMQGAFYGCESLKTVNMQSGLEEIGDEAFKGCKSLKTVSIPNSVEEIGSEAFNGCTALKSITLPSTLEEISKDMFRNCEALTKITIPKNTEEIKSSAFYGCKSLKTVIIPNGVEEIGSNAFNGCKALESFTVPKSCEYLGKKALKNCNIKTLKVAKGNKKYIAKGNCIIDKSDKKLVIGASTSVIPDDGSVKTIAEAAFSGTKIKEINIPKGVKTIEKEAFYKCKSLKKVTFPSTLTKIGDKAFAYCTKLKKAALPDKATKLGDLTFSYCDSLENFVLPKNLKEFDFGTIMNTPSLKSITFNKKLETVWSTYSDCNNLEKIKLAKGNKYFTVKGNCLICNKYKKVVLGCKNSVIPADGTVKSIGCEAFANCNELTEIKIPNGVKEICESAFADCNNLSKISLPKSLKKIRSGAFYQTSLTGVKVDEKILETSEEHFSQDDDENYYPPFGCCYKIKLSKDEYTYNGKAKKPKITMTDFDGKKFTPYKIKYQKGRKNVGTYSATIYYTDDSLSAEKRVVYFDINPKGTKLTSISNGNNKLTVKWQKQSKQTSGYQLQYSTSSKFKNAKTVTVSGSSKTAKTINGLKNQKKYYVRIRTYKTVDGKRYYSDWSKKCSKKTA